MGTKRVTLKEIAHKAECSVSAVSKALNGESDVSPTTRHHILTVAAELGYKKSSTRPKSSRGPKSFVLGFDSFGSLYSGELLSGALEAATKGGIRLAVEILPPSPARQMNSAWIRDQVRAGYSGAVLVTSEVTEEMVKESQALDFQLVTIDPKSEPIEGVVSIGATNWAGGTAASEYLIELGHQRIAYAGYDRTVGFARERFAGFQSGMERAHIPIDPTLVLEGQTDFEAGLRIGEQIILHPNPPTAVACICDMVAFGLIERFRREGWNVPERISVVGFDDVAPARWFSPSLTTVRQPLWRMGASAVRTLVRMVEGKELDSHHVQLATRLVIRDSTAPLTPESA